MKWSIGIGMMWLLALASCADPDTAILATFDSEETERFKRGRAAASRCWACHDLAGTVKKTGPSLLGIYGRQSGRSPDYQASDALLAASIVWDDRTLGAFLANPGRFVPGNAMVSPGIADAGVRADLLFYLRHVTRPGARGDSDD